jgi:hypothetical protein
LPFHIDRYRLVPCRAVPCGVAITCADATKREVVSSDSSPDPRLISDWTWLGMQSSAHRAVPHYDVDQSGTCGCRRLSGARRNVRAGIPRSVRRATVTREVGRHVVDHPGRGGSELELSAYDLRPRTRPVVVLGPRTSSRWTTYGRSLAWTIDERRGRGCSPSRRPVSQSLPLKVATHATQTV